MLGDMGVAVRNQTIVHTCRSLLYGGTNLDSSVQFSVLMDAVEVNSYTVCVSFYLTGCIKDNKSLMWRLAWVFLEVVVIAATTHDRLLTIIG